MMMAASGGTSACQACGVGTPDGARFCPGCGASLAPAAALPEERKVVSTLFCDIVGFTAMSEQADPEDVDSCLRAFGALAREVIERYGGSVEKYIGDAVVGVFGVPAVHEDDPERAVRAALRLLEGLESLRSPDGSPVEARAGIMTGELLVAHDVDPALGNGFVAGDAVNTAARLEVSADPGCVVVGGLTHALTEHAIRYERLPSCPAKGKSRPLERWRALHPIALVRRHVNGGRLSPLVGRDGELTFLKGLLRRAVDGRQPQLALVLGDPGIGKTRLVHELFTAIDTSKDMITWRHGRCVPYGEGRSFWALREIVQAHCGILETHGPEEVAALLERAVEPGPDHRWLCERLRPLVGLDAPDVDQEENFAAWLRFFRETASRRPLVAVIEDLHWADDGELAFMDYIAQHLPELPVLLVGTARPQVFEQHPAFAAGGRVTRIWLDRLSDDETRALVRALPEMVGSGGPIVDLVALRAEGNPFFAEELARLLADSGGDASVALARLPQSVQAVIAARLDALSPEAKAILTDGAVIGAAFWRGALGALAIPGSVGIDEGLAELVDRQLIRAVRQPLLEGEQEYAFCHGLVREVAYGEIPRGARAAKHAAFARWLEEKLGERARGDLSDVLAGHFGAAEELARAAGDAALAADVAGAAIEYLTLAGDRAMGLDVRASSRHYERALALAGSEHAARPGLLARSAEAFFQEGRYRDSEAALLQAAVGLSAAGDRRAAALAAARRADVLYALGDLGVTLQLEGALALLNGHGPCEERVTVLGKLGRSLWLAGDPRRGLEKLEEALSLAHELDLPEPVLFLGYRGGIRCIMGDVGGLDDYDRALRLAAGRGRVDEASLLTFNQADALLSYRGPGAAVEALTAGLAAARRRRLEAIEALPIQGRTLTAGLLGEWDAEAARRLSVNLVEALGMSGSWDEALTTAGELLPALERSEAGSDLVIVRTQEAMLRVCRGEAPLAAPFLGWLERCGLESEIPWIAAYALLSAAPVRFGLGQGAMATSLLEAWERRPRPGSGPNYVAYLPGAVRTALATGSFELAARLCLGLEGMLPMQRNVLASLHGMLAERRGEPEAADAFFASAASRWRGFGVPYEEGHALLGRGRCQLTLGRPQQARAPLEEARAIFARLGARPAVAETDALLS
jgi:class 3 adenylate cyclase/tetratricopeptide (TPR) repeat protein